MSQYNYVAFLCLTSNILREDCSFFSSLLTKIIPIPQWSFMWYIGQWGVHRSFLEAQKLINYKIIHMLLFTWTNEKYFGSFDKTIACKCPLTWRIFDNSYVSKNSLCWKMCTLSGETAFVPGGILFLGDLFSFKCFNSHCFLANLPVHTNSRHICIYCTYTYVNLAHLLLPQCEILSSA